MQVNFKEEFQKAKEKISQEEVQFIKENYKYESIENGFQYIIYAYQIHRLPSSIKNQVNKLRKKGIGYYSPQSGHSIDPSLIH